ncbi:glycoside hydrolase family 28 protein [Anaerobacillus sp. CMMVII]|uniref:glycoside hydrolase family 28 protein n=1 Tax=Anaerobacillus sp. CMMVII TaxID=2755588 RepID=UPI0021B82D22|nr:glycoside hydrolase family 28 protein [Anaerobacillus sp. CMMVII]MCT8139620.1 glycoside hydrolase family 28 protein [Anaerobacillus sp. CMMVII]
MTSTSKQSSKVTVLLPDIPKREFLLTDFGAVGDGQFVCTSAFQEAIEACSKAGGGKVIVPPGIWLTGPIALKSKLNLHLEKGALLLFSRNFDDYPLILSSFEGEEIVRCKSPLDGENLDHVAITGEGVIDGSGDAWRPVKKFKMTEIQWNKLIERGGIVDHSGKEVIWWPTEAAMRGRQRYAELRAQKTDKVEDFLAIRDFLRPNLLSLRKCKHILLDGPTFQNSPAWNLHPWICEHVTVRNVTVRNPWFGQNGDGLDLESCRYALVENSIFDVGDDAICIKSGKDEAGRKLGIPCEDIEIRGCQVYSGHGGFVIGSEMSGGARNISVSDCSFFGTDVGLRFKSTRGRGGLIENITIDNIRMNNIAKEAIVFHMFYEISDEDIAATQVPVSDETPIFRNISINNVACTGSGTALLLKGLPEMPLEKLVFENITAKSTKGIIGSHCKNVHFSNIMLETEEGPLFTFENFEEMTY